MHVALSIQQGDCPASALNEQFDSGAFAGRLGWDFIFTLAVMQPRLMVI
jgi:hypothetical protein